MALIIGPGPRCSWKVVCLMPDGTLEARKLYAATGAIALREAEDIEDRAWMQAGKIHPRDKAKLGK